MTLPSWIRNWIGRASPVRTPRRARPDANRARPTLEVLEDRTAPAVLTVNTTTDGAANHSDSQLTLREAIAIVNSGSTAGLSAGELAFVNTSAPLGTNDS